MSQEGGVKHCQLALDPDGLPLLLALGGLERLEHSAKILVCSRYCQTRSHRPVLSCEKCPQSTTKTKNIMRM